MGVLFCLYLVAWDSLRYLRTISSLSWSYDISCQWKHLLQELPLQGFTGCNECFQGNDGWCLMERVNSGITSPRITHCDELPLSHTVVEGRLFKSGQLRGRYLLVRTYFTVKSINVSAKRPQVYTFSPSWIMILLYTGIVKLKTLPGAIHDSGSSSFKILIRNKSENRLIADWGQCSNTHFFVFNNKYNV